MNADAAPEQFPMGTPLCGSVCETRKARERDTELTPILGFDDSNEARLPLDFSGDGPITSNRGLSPESG